MVRAAFTLILLTLPAWVTPARAAPQLCEGAALQAAQEAGVPLDLMRAITLAETGRRHEGRMQPWPWAANLEGQGHWFETRAELERFAEAAVAAGRTSIDIGCFQINWRWHGRDYPRPAALADPLTGARHAARFLQALRSELGSWEAAAGAYHSRSPQLAARYGARIAQLRADLGPVPLPGPALAAAAPDAPRRADWLPQAGGPPAALASLLPAGPAARPFLSGLSP